MESLMVIRGTNEKDPIDDQPLFWSNSYGWADLSSAEVYRESDVKDRKFNLPLGGEWKNLRSAISELVEWVEQGEVHDA